jgi:hypothetical protein
MKEIHVEIQMRFDMLHLSAFSSSSPFPFLHPQPLLPKVCEDLLISAANTRLLMQLGKEIKSEGC